MRAAVLHSFGEPLVVEAIAPLPVSARSARVRVDASGVCHSDLTFARGGVPGVRLPIILGHEGAGTVLEIGDQVSRVGVGDRVIASFVSACGNCWQCLRDRSNLCERSGEGARAVRGRRADGSPVQAMTGLGTFAEEIVADETSLVRVETDLAVEQLALIGCGATTGVGAVLNTARVEAGSSVAVVGCGGVGQFVVQGARIAGASRIFAIDTVAMKREAAGRSGATDLIDPAEGDPVEQVRALTAGRGVEYAFEVIGLPETILQAFDLACRGGCAVVVGMASAGATVSFPAGQLFAPEKRILGSLYGSARVRRDFPRLVRLVETGQLDIASVVSRRISLDAVNEAFQALEAGEVLRSVIT